VKCAPATCLPDCLRTAEGIVHRFLRYQGEPDVQNIIIAIALIVLTVLLHESGHFLAALALRLNVRRCGVNSHGVYIVRETGEPAQNTVVILAGPAMNLLFAALFGGTLFGILNLIMALMNLIPLANTDGRHLMNVLAKKTA